jgi:hypothetical protein
MMVRRTSGNVWDTPNDGVIYNKPDLHGGDLLEPIGFLRWPWQFKPAPKPEPAPKKRARVARDNRSSR